MKNNEKSKIDLNAREILIRSFQQQPFCLAISIEARTRTANKYYLLLMYFVENVCFDFIHHIN